MVSDYSRVWFSDRKIKYNSSPIVPVGEPWDYQRINVIEQIPCFVIPTTIWCGITDILSFGCDHLGWEYFAGSILVSLILWGIFWLFFRQQRPAIKVRSGVSRQVDSPISPILKKQPKPYFAGKGSHLDVGGYLLKDPMIYVVDSREYGDFDASLLCLKRTISPLAKKQPKHYRTGLV